jgi:hypothetical protein
MELLNFELRRPYIRPGGLQMTDDLLRHLAPNGSMSVLPASHDVNRLAHLTHVDYKKKFLKAQEIP